MCVCVHMRKHLRVSNCSQNKHLQGSIIAVTLHLLTVRMVISIARVEIIMVGFLSVLLIHYYFLNVYTLLHFMIPTV